MNKYAFPTSYADDAGLTKLEYVATQLLAARIANESVNYSVDGYVTTAVSPCPKTAQGV